MSERVISVADLNNIESNLSYILNNLEVVGNGVVAVNQNVNGIYDEIEDLAEEFRNFIQIQVRSNNMSNAQQEIIRINQDLEKRFGHYDIVRRATTGILQANDVGIVKKEIMSNVTEELMINAPNYWLAPCLVALAAWINDQPEIADKALREAIKRDDEKTSLFFALLCRRVERKDAALKWTQRYFSNQNEEELDRKTVIVLDAFASGLLGVDSEGLVSKQIEKWIDHLSNKEGFIEQQSKQWSDAINLKRKPIESDEYTYLREYSNTWPVLEDIMEGALLHTELLDYFTNIFEQKTSTDDLKLQLDDILNNLVSEFDDEELPLRKEKKFNELIVQFKGDEDRASKNMRIEQTAFEEHKDFTQLLTDAAMNPDVSHASVSTQKFAIALSKDWIGNAYNDVVAQNRMNIPNEIEINVDTFNATTTDGQNEEELIHQFNMLVDSEKTEILSKTDLSAFEKFCLWGGAVIAFIGLMMSSSGNQMMGLIAIIAGIGMIINHYSKKKKVSESRQNIEKQFAEKRETGSQIIRSVLAEVVDFRHEFAEKDAESARVIDFIEQLSPDQYVTRLSNSNRRIKMQ